MSWLIVALSLANDERQSMAAPCLTSWMEAFARILIDCGESSAEALKRGQDLVAQLEGALVIASSSGNREPFARAVSRLAAQRTLR